MNVIKLDLLTVNPANFQAELSPRPLYMIMSFLESPLVPHLWTKVPEWRLTDEYRHRPRELFTVTFATVNLIYRATAIKFSQDLGIYNCLWYSTSCMPSILWQQTSSLSAEMKLLCVKPRCILLQSTLNPLNPRENFYRWIIMNLEAWSSFK